MTKVWIFAASMIVATPAAAERNALITVDLQKASIIGMDLDTIRTVDGRQRAWTFAMFISDVEAKPRPYYVQSLTELDCKLQRSQVLSTKLFGEGGVSVGNLDPTAWTYPAPNTAEYRVLEYGCGKDVPADNIAPETLPQMFDKFLKVMRGRGKIK